METRSETCTEKYTEEELKLSYVCARVCAARTILEILQIIYYTHCSIDIIVDLQIDV